MQLSLFWSHYPFFSFSFYSSAFHPALGVPVSIKRKKRSENGTKKERELHELPYTEIVKSGTVRLASGIR